MIYSKYILVHAYDLSFFFTSLTEYLTSRCTLNRVPASCLLIQSTVTISNENIDTDTLQSQVTRPRDHVILCRTDFSGSSSKRSKRFETFSLWLNTHFKYQTKTLRKPHSGQSMKQSLKRPKPISLATRVKLFCINYTAKTNLFLGYCMDLGGFPSLLIGTSLIHLIDVTCETLYLIFEFPEN